MPLLAHNRRSKTSGTKRQRRKAARPGELLEAGFAEFAEQGFVGTSIDSVAKRAGVAKGTVYLYFDSKEALFEAAVRARIVPMLGEIGNLADAFEGPTDELLRAILRIVHAKYGEADARTLLRIMIGESQRFPALIDFYFREVVSKAITIMSRVIERGIARGEFKRSAATETPVIIMAPAMVAALWQLTFSSVHPIPPEQFMKAHTALLLEGLKAD